MPCEITPVEDIPLFDELDRQFAALMIRLRGRLDSSEDGKQAATLRLTSAMASRFSREGHVCFDFSQAGKFLSESGFDIVLPEEKTWTQALADSLIVGDAGDQAPYTPLVKDAYGRIYLHRYWAYQRAIARFIKRHIGDQGCAFRGKDVACLQNGLWRLFGDDLANPEKESAVGISQAVAAVAAVKSGFCIISGGPGTGKTTTVAKILALLAEQAAEDALRIALVAPTGKAANRLSQAVIAVKNRLDCSQVVLDAIPEEAQTLHRFLGSRPGSVYFRHDAKNPVGADVVVVDEASMVDVALMAKLMDALSDTCRLILVGDKDQLSSVEAGSVFADICAAGRMESFSAGFLKDIGNIGIALPRVTALLQQQDGSKAWLDDSLVLLERNYRFDQNSGISQLSRAIRQGDDKSIFDILTDERYSDVSWDTTEAAEAWLEKLWPKRLWADVREWFNNYLAAGDDIVGMFRCFEQFRILCALREGPQGVRALNAMIETGLKKERIVSSDQMWYSGRPVMVTKNDYHLRLFNGDVGITILGDDGRPSVCFWDGSTVRRIHPRRLPPHETVYAMTVHKSQGAEFGRVLLVLPDRDAPVLTRELLYTAVTRAGRSVHVIGPEEIVAAAIARPTLRMSGLTDELVAVLD